MASSIIMCAISSLLVFFFSSRRRHTRCALVTGVQTCALPRPCPSDGPMAASRYMSVNPGPTTAIRTRSDNDGKTDRIGMHLALIGYGRVSTAAPMLSLLVDEMNEIRCAHVSTAVPTSHLLCHLLLDTLTHLNAHTP